MSLKSFIATVSALHSHPKIEKPEGSEGCPSLTDSTLAISAFVLDALQHASQFAPIPFLQMAASVALSIVQQAQVCNSSSLFRLTANYFRRQEEPRITSNALRKMHAILCISCLLLTRLGRVKRANRRMIWIATLKSSSSAVDSVYPSIICG